ncbi:hypothetical protein FBUS_10694 [Fasciolopsis buskii]|uniref:Uncharacterized protein n=1 Tax=Fasciolopsis buskii TaxID=27845 RepID=A0A8E0S5B8_9TREM|nr:hypothetical protein FBUS_10694 [Fasciolopsis buski]
MSGEECRACKWVAVGLPLCLSGYIVYAAKQQYSRYTGAKRWIYLSLCGGLSLGK